MKNLLLLLFMSPCFFSFAQLPAKNYLNESEKFPIKEPFIKQANTRELVYTPQKGTHYYWDGSGWEYGADHHYSYDQATCLIATDTAFVFGMKSYLTVYSYDSLLAILPPDQINSPSDQTSYFWDGNDWISNYRYTYTYYPQGYLRTYVSLTYDATFQQWDTTYAWNRIRTFDGDDNPIDLIRQVYNTNTHQYENDYKQIFQYYSPGYLSGYDFYDWINSQFQLIFRVTAQAYNYYNSSIDYQLNYSLQQNWTGSAWIHAYQTSMTYDSYNSLFFLTQLWTGTVWENSVKYATIFDSHGNYIEYNDSLWNGTGYDLNYIDKQILTYGVNGEILEDIYQYADASTPLVNSSKRNFSDFIVCNLTTSAHQVANTTGFTVFPNPSQGLFTVSWKDLGKNEHQLTVMDFFGRIVFRSELSGSSGSRQVYLSNIPAGNYWVVIEDGVQVFMQQANIR